MKNSMLSGIASGSERLSSHDLHRRALGQIRASVPQSWDISAKAEPALGPNRPDALWQIRGPNAVGACVVIEIKARALAPSEVQQVLKQLRLYAPTCTPMLVCPFLSPRARELLDAADASYVDATGNVRLHLESPALFIRLDGATKDPWRETRPVHSLKGPAAARVVRALSDIRPPYRAHDLAELASTPASSVTRILDFLEREALLGREPRGPVLSVSVADLIRRWAQDYGLTRSNRSVTVLEPRGMEALTRKLRSAEWRYAVTGSLAAAAIAPLASTRLVAVYVESIDLATTSLGLRPVEAGANVLLVEPFDLVAFERTGQVDGLNMAALSQVAADLLTSPGRGPAEGEELLRWMEEHEHDWRG
jgi:hypothetical protein